MKYKDAKKRKTAIRYQSEICKREPPRRSLAVIRAHQALLGAWYHMKVINLTNKNYY